MTYLLDIDKANALNDFFASISVETIMKCFFLKCQILWQRIYCSFEIEEGDVLAYLRHIDTKKAYGPDEISQIFFIFFRHAADVLAPVFTKLFRLCLSMGSYPTLWKRANVILFKKGILSKLGIIDRCPYFVLEVKYMRKYYINICITVHHKLSVYQSGFLPEHSTVAHLIEMEHVILRELDQRKEVLCAYDISKAFDKVSHRALIFKLGRFGILGDFIHLLENCLTSLIEYNG
jgi:hypothetical protein